MITSGSSVVYETGSRDKGTRKMEGMIVRMSRSGRNINVRNEEM